MSILSASARLKSSIAKFGRAPARRDNYSPTVCANLLARTRDSDAHVPQRWMLVFAGCFCLYCSVPVDDDEASRSAIGLSRQSGAVPFATTHWSVVLEAQGESPAAEEALEILCRTYWRPLYSFVRREGIRPEEAQDLTQGFFALLLERRDLNAVRKEKGRLRSYLLVSLKHFLASERHRASGVKRCAYPLDELLESEVADFELAETLSADQLYERHWALAVLEQVLGFSKDLTKVEAVFAARTCRAIRALTNCYEFRSPRFRSSRAGRGLP